MGDVGGGLSEGRIIRWPNCQVANNQTSKSNLIIQ